MQEPAISTWTTAAWSCCTGVEDVLDVTMAQQTELDYVDLILNSDPEKYLGNVTGSHGLED